MALVYKKENGYPINIKIETEPYEEVMEDNEFWKGYKSYVIDEEENIIASFIHGEYRDRIRWVDGFFDGIKYMEKSIEVNKMEELFIDSGEWKGPDTPLLNEDESSNLEVGDWIVTYEGKVRKIKMDDQDNLLFENIERFATKTEAKNAKKINELVQELKQEKASNRSTWNSYGSELCAGEMIKNERDLENKIAELRIDENL